MKFKFRLETVMRQRKAEQDIAQREYAEAQLNVRDQLARIEKMYTDIDEARMMSDQINSKGGACAEHLASIEEFIAGQKLKIEIARKRARELMAVEEEKHEVLVEKVQALKILEKLKERKKDEFKKLVKKKEIKEAEDIVIMKFNNTRDV